MWTLFFSSYRNHELKLKLWWIGARERKKGVFFVTFVLFKGNFFVICTLSQCIEYWISFQNIYLFTYKKVLLHTLFLLVFKIVESFQCILKFFQAEERVETTTKTTIHNLKKKLYLLGISGFMAPKGNSKLGILHRTAWSLIKNI